MQNSLTQEDIKKYIEQFKANSGPNSYIPYRPNCFCLASYFAKRVKKRINIFTVSNGNLTLQKAVSTAQDQLDWPVINILHAQDHFTRLYNPLEGDIHKKQCEQIYKNY